MPTSEGAALHVAPVEAMVDCAPEVLGQILRNVIGNALKYRAPQRRCRLDIAIRTQRASVAIDVVDNGTGMDAGAARRAFEPFFRASSDGTGHGLGLAIVDSYVRALHGSVELASEVGVGTRVSILLPRASPRRRGQAPRRRRHRTHPGLAPEATCAEGVNPAARRAATRRGARRKTGIDAQEPFCPRLVHPA